MKYIKKFENIDFENDWDEEEIDPTYNEIPIIGDTVEITDKLKFYIKKHNWVQNMYKLIGERYRVDNIERYQEMNCVFVSRKGFYIPIDCVKKIK